MSAIDLAAFRATPLVRDPFDHLIVPRFITQAAWPGIQAAFPQLAKAGSFPLSQTTYGPAFRALMDDLQGPAMRKAFEEKFDIDLTGRPTMITVRGQSDLSDGNIHTDSKSKIITVLIYMNPVWESAGGRLRLLRSATDLEDVVTEVPPEEGVLLAFRRSDNSWHGHRPFVGPRRVIQLNWVTDGRVARWQTGRHRVSAWFKRVFGLARPAARFIRGGR
jgi:SM-20-related protein